MARTINLSLGLLDDGQRARFAELAAFPEDADIPIGIVAGLWKQIAGLNESRTKDLLIKCYGLSLLLGLDLNQRTLRLHDTTRHFLQNQAGRDGLVAQHQRLVRALDGVAESVDLRPDPPLLLPALPHHLAQANERQLLDSLLLDPNWLKAKLAATGNCGAYRRLRL